MVKGERLVYLGLTAQHLLKKYVQKKFRKANISITPSHTGILFSLEKNGPQSMNDLSELLFVKNSTITGLIDRLEKNNLVKRNSIGNDRRKWHITITDKGIDEINKAKKIIKSINDEIKAGHSQSEIEGMQAVLKGFFKKFQ